MIDYGTGILVRELSVGRSVGPLPMGAGSPTTTVQARFRYDRRFLNSEPRTGEWTVVLVSALEVVSIPR